MSRDFLATHGHGHDMTSTAKKLNMFISITNTIIITTAIILSDYYY